MTLIIFKCVGYSLLSYGSSLFTLVLLVADVNTHCLSPTRSLLSASIGVGRRIEASVVFCAEEVALNNITLLVASL